MKKIKKKECSECHVKSDNFYTNLCIYCKECEKKKINEKNNTPAGKSIKKFKNHVLLFKKENNIKFNYKVKLPPTTYDILYEKVFQKKSILNIYPCDQEKEPLLVWVMDTSQPFVTNNYIMITRPEFDEIQKHGRNVRKTLDVIYPDSVKTPIEKDAIIQKVHEYDQLKKDNGLWIKDEKLKEMKSIPVEPKKKNSRKRKKEGSSSSSTSSSSTNNSSSDEEKKNGIKKSKKDK